MVRAGPRRSAVGSASKRAGLTPPLSGTCPGRVKRAGPPTRWTLHYRRNHETGDTLLMEQITSALAPLGPYVGPILAGIGVAAFAGQSLLLAISRIRRSLLCFIIVSASAALLLAFGFIFTATTSLLLTIGWAFSLLLTMVALVLLRQTEKEHGENSLVAISTIAGLLVTAVTAVQVIYPAQPVFGAPGACNEAPVTASQVTVRTGSSGQNVRTGPATSYPVARRYDASCLLGVDGYCIGAPIVDSTSELPDVRWFRARFSHNYLPAGLVFETRGVDADLGLQTEHDCPGGRDDPGFSMLPELTVKKAGAAVTGDFTPTGTTLIGFATATGNGKRVRITQLSGRVHHLQPLDFNGDGDTEDKAASEPADTSTITFPSRAITLTDADETGTLNGTIYAAVPCLAANVPAYTGAAFYRVESASVVRRYQPGLHPTFDATGDETTPEARLVAAACALGR